MIQLEAILLRMTDKAILVLLEDSRELWLPKSQVEFWIESGGFIICNVPEWLARKQNIWNLEEDF